jgi:hypothetical protein
MWLPKWRIRTKIFKLGKMKHSTGLERFDSILKKVRRRLEILDQKYQIERTLLQEELEELIDARRFLADFIVHNRRVGVVQSVLEAKATHADPGDETSFREMPWGRYASGVDKVLYVIKEAGARGLSRPEIVDEIERISSARPPLNSVTTWLYRAKKRGQTRNRRGRWYIAQ